MKFFSPILTSHFTLLTSHVLMLNLASLCFPDQEKSCFYCCPPIRAPEADPLDNIEAKLQLLRTNRKELQKNLNNPREISGEECWGLGFLDDQERQAGCLLHPLRHQGRDLRHLTGYQFKCANALCREAQVFAQLSQTEQTFCLALCRGMDSIHYSSRRNPLMRLLAWEEEIVQIIVRESLKNRADKFQNLILNNFLSDYEFLWQKLDFRLDGYLVLQIAEKKRLSFLRRNRENYIELREALIVDLKHNLKPQITPAADLLPAHKLKIPLNLSRLLKFGASLWELPSNCEAEIEQLIEPKLTGFCHLHNH
ncbi:MAG: hypothetical protein J7M09_05815 [Deltaproteobacteria bacterium]|nr:hypothetical protein [Candidatus Tharpella sp.]